MPDHKPTHKVRKRGHYKQGDWLEFARFKAMPIILRNEEWGFDTEQKFADKFKVAQRTLITWKKDEKFWEEVRASWKRWGKDRTPMVILGLYKNAVKSGHGTDAKAWMQIVEDWRERLDVTDDATRKSIDALTLKMRQIFDKEGGKK